MVTDRENQSADPTKKKSAVLGDHGELWIKLKLPKDEEQDFVGLEDEINPPPQWGEDHHHHQQQQLSTTKNNNTPRICHVCNKEFRSGKALGGHMRIHFQAHKEPIFNKKLKPSQPIRFKKRKRSEEDTLADIAKKINISKNKMPTNHGAAGFTDDPTCSLCCKTFPSMKSLFGHMRCHPDREWRGIQPPAGPAVKTSSYSSLVSDVEPQESSDDQVNSADVLHEDDQAQAPLDDLTKSLRGWSATAKRGRKKTILDSSEEDEEFLNAAHELIRLAHGGSSESSLADNQTVEKYEATKSKSVTCKAESRDMNRVSESKKRSFEELSSAGYMKGHPVKQLSLPSERKSEGCESNGTIDKMAAYEPGFSAGKSVNCEWVDTSNWPKEYDEDKDCTDEEPDGKDMTKQLNHKISSTNNGKLIVLKNKKKRKKIKDLDLVHDASPVHQAMTATPDKYRCNTCDKSFPTHQALGGHRSSHHKIRVSIHNSAEGWMSTTDEDENLSNSPILEDEEMKGSEGAAASSKQVDDTYQCKICSRTFATGKALGGHKKCHSAGATEAPSSQLTSLGEPKHGRFLVFDLNAAPPLDDDAGFESERLAPGGGGGASSSFNSVEFPVFESSSSML